MFYHRFTQVILPIFFQLPSILSYSPNHFQDFSSFSAQNPFDEVALRLSKNTFGDDGRLYACSGRNIFAFEKNGSVAWDLKLKYTCNADISPEHGGSRKIYLVAEKRVLKIHPSRIGTSEPAVEVFFGPVETEIVGISISLSSSCVLINVENRGVFAYKLQGELLWSAGPVLYQHGYQQGCAKNITECYFTSVPVIDHCEASIYIANTIGELYSLAIRGLYFKWIQDLSSYGNKFIITPGNNNLLYVIIPDTGLLLALEVSMGNILWQGSIGPLSSDDYEPVVDANGWLSVGSLDGFLYSFSPSGTLKKFRKSTGSSSVIHLNPVLDCSGSAVYVSWTEIETIDSGIFGEKAGFSALKSKSSIFTMLVPASGSFYLSESNHSNLLFNLSLTDLHHFVIDERTLLSFFAVSRNGNPFLCRTTRQRLSSSCSLVESKNISIYSGDEGTILLFLLFESVLLVLLVALVKYCCIFWKKKKIKNLSLGRFLEKRHSLKLQKKEFDRTITELEQRASKEEVENEVLEKLNDLVKERDSIERKLSTTYSLGRDGEYSWSRFLLPLYNGKFRSCSFQGSKRESGTPFYSVSDASASKDSSFDENMNRKAEGKCPVVAQSSGDDEIPSSTQVEAKMQNNAMVKESRSLRRRASSHS